MKTIKIDSAVHQLLRRKAAEMGDTIQNIASHILLAKLKPKK
jgi:hypothetical protein